MKLIQTPPKIFQVSLGIPVLGLLCQFQVFPSPAAGESGPGETFIKQTRIREKRLFPLKTTKVEAAGGDKAAMGSRRFQLR